MIGTKKTFLAILIFSIFIITAYFSDGYYYADEHYQLIEPALYINGEVNMSDLTWEFQEKIRPSFQPYLASMILSISNVVGIDSPFTQAFILRLITALSVLIGIRFFTQQIRKHSETKFPEYTYLFYYLIWFIPFLACRFSSETFSGLCLLISIGVLFKKKSSPIVFGLLMGLGVLFRPHILFAFVGILIWLLMHKSNPITYYVRVSFSFLVVMAFGIVLDSIFYDSFQCSQFNYFLVHVWYKTVPDFGTQPWYWHLIYAFKSPHPLIGLLLLSAFILKWKTLKNSMIIYCMAAFLIFHMCMGHKEARFLFPLCFLVPYILQLVLGSIQGYASISLVKKLALAFGILLLSLNSIGLIALGSKSAGIGRTAVMEFVEENIQGDVLIVFSERANPYDEWNAKPNKFYTNSRISSTTFSNYVENENALENSDKTVLLSINRKFLQTDSIAAQIKELGFVKVYQSIPDWIITANQCYNGFDELATLELYAKE